MTEQQWLTCTDPSLMFDFQGLGLVGDRKRRLFACACARRFWDRLSDVRSRTAIEIAEGYGDGKATVEELNAAWSAAGEAFDDSPGFAEEAAWGTADEVSQFLDVPSLLIAGLRDEDGDWSGEQKAQADLLRYQLGNPFCRVSFDPGWRTPAVLSLSARAAEGDFTGLPILADALEEAGCADRSILDHLRAPGPHVRGCWAVDLLLAKE